MESEKSIKIKCDSHLKVQTMFLADCEVMFFMFKGVKLLIHGLIASML